MSNHGICKCCGADRSGPSAEGHSADCPQEQLDVLAQSFNELKQYAKHLTGCGIFEGEACDCGLLKVIG